MNGSYYVDYQDCQFVPARFMLCSGTKNSSLPGFGMFAFGGLELVDLASHTPIHQVPVLIVSGRKRPRSRANSELDVRRTRRWLHSVLLPAGRLAAVRREVSVLRRVLVDELQDLRLPCQGTVISPNLWGLASGQSSRWCAVIGRQRSVANVDSSDSASADHPPPFSRIEPRFRRSSWRCCINTGKSLILTAPGRPRPSFRIESTGKDHYLVRFRTRPG